MGKTRSQAVCNKGNKDITLAHCMQLATLYLCTSPFSLHFASLGMPTKSSYWASGSLRPVLYPCLITPPPPPPSCPPFRTRTMSCCWSSG